MLCLGEGRSKDSRSDLDTLPTSCVVAVGIFGSGREIHSPDALDSHCIRALVVIDFSPCPVDCVIIILRISTCPDADSNIARRLRVVCTSLRLIVCERSHDLSINVPFQLLLRPTSCVVVKVVLRSLGHRVPFCAFDGIGCVAFTVIIILGVGGVAADEFEVNFIEIVGLKYDTYLMVNSVLPHIVSTGEVILLTTP